MPSNEVDRSLSGLGLLEQRQEAAGFGGASTDLTAVALAGEHASAETAALMMACHTLLNLDEFLNRR